MSSGLRDWKIQRLSAVMLVIYVLFLSYNIVTIQPMDFIAWDALFSTSLMQIATMVALLALLWHTWIGMWTITTDYLKWTSVRLATQAIILFMLIAEGLWGFNILWEMV